MTDWTPPPPGNAREQIPSDILDLIEVPPYLSTACEVAQLLDGAINAHPERADEIAAWRDRQHQRCRLNNKFTGQLCMCPHHGRGN